MQTHTPLQTPDTFIKEGKETGRTWVCTRWSSVSVTWTALGSGTKLKPMKQSWTKPTGLLKSFIKTGKISSTPRNVSLNSFIIIISTRFIYLFIYTLYIIKAMKQTVELISHDQHVFTVHVYLKISFKIYIYERFSFSFCGWDGFTCVDNLTWIGLACLRIMYLSRTAEVQGCCCCLLLLFTFLTSVIRHTCCTLWMSACFIYLFMGPCHKRIFISLAWWSLCHFTPSKVLGTILRSGDFVDSSTLLNTNFHFGIVYASCKSLWTLD